MILTVFIFRKGSPSDDAAIVGYDVRYGAK